MALLCGGVLIAGLYAGAPRADAFESRLPAGSPFGSFARARGIAVDQSTGNVYVVDSASGEVKVFGPEGGAPVGGGPSSITGAGTPSGSFDLENKRPSEPAAVGNELYVPDWGHNLVDKFALNGPSEYEFLCEIKGFGGFSGSACQSEGGSPTGLYSGPVGAAVDSSGDVYITDFGTFVNGRPTGGHVYELNPAGEAIHVFDGFLEKVAGSEYDGPAGYIAVAPDGTIYVETYTQHGVFKLRRSSPTGEAEGQPEELFTEREGFEKGSIVGMTFDGASGRLLIDRESVVEELNGSNEVVGSFGQGIIDCPEDSCDIAVNEATGSAYVVNGLTVYRFGADGVVPEVTTGGASEVKQTSVTLEGMVAPNPPGKDFKYYFQYGTSAAYGQSTPVESAESEKAVSVHVVGLKIGQGYYYRLVAENENGTHYGQRAEVSTLEAVENVETGEASGVTPDSATLNGSLEPDQVEAHYYFQYGETAKYGLVSPLVPGTPINGLLGEVKSAGTTLTGLKPGTEYHFRLVASNELGVGEGHDATFETLPAVEGVTTGGATGVGVTSAMLSGSLTPDEVPAHYYFEYGESEAYGSLSPVLPGTLVDGAMGEEVSAGASIDGLHGNTVYYYRLAATDTFGTTHGATQTLKTLPAKPTVSGVAVSEVHPREALVSGVVFPEGNRTTYQIVYGPTAGYGTSLPVGEGDIPAGGPGVTVSESLAGLQPGTTYHYAIVASNTVGITVSADQTFTTAPTAPTVVVTGAAGEVSQNSASISGTVDPQGAATSYEFDIGTDTSYGSRVFGELSASSGPVPLTISLQGLAAGTLYHYRLVATNTYGTTYGADETFTTPGFSSALLATPVGAPLVPSPVFAPFSISGASVIASTKGKATHRRKPKTKRKRKTARRRRGEKAGSPIHGHGKTGGGR